MTIIANGKRKQVEDGATVSDYLDSLQLAPTQVVIEYNHEPLRRELFAVTRLRQDDLLEIAQMVGGG